jgi:hypothetical protein
LHLFLAGVLMILVRHTSSLVDSSSSVTCSEAVQRCEKDGECAHNLKKLQRSCGASSESL